jgi:hypothetical protein
MSGFGSPAIKETSVLDAGATAGGGIAVANPTAAHDAFAGGATVGGGQFTCLAAGGGPIGATGNRGRFARGAAGGGDMCATDNRGQFAFGAAAGGCICCVAAGGGKTTRRLGSAAARHLWFRHLRVQYQGPQATLVCNPLLGSPVRDLVMTVDVVVGCCCKGWCLI